MTTFGELPAVDERLLEELARLAPPEVDKSPGKGRPAGRRGSTRKGEQSLGPLDVEKFLTHYGIPFNVKQRGSRSLYRFDHCLFDESHGKNHAYIQKDANGALSYCCSHESCRNNPEANWAGFRKRVAGDDSLAPFCEGYNADWKPKPGKKKALTPSGAAAPKDKKQAGGNGPRVEDYPFLTISDKGRLSFNPAILAKFLAEKYKPIFSEGRDYGGLLYRYDPGGVWRQLPFAQVELDCWFLLEDAALSRRVNDAVTLLQMQSYIGEPEKIQADPMWLNLKNCMLDVRTMKTAAHDPKYLSRVQMPVKYDTKATCGTWVETLAGIFADDTKKADTLQEFFGYCLYPKVLFPCAIFQIGEGGNGKGTVQRILEAMLGEDNVSNISLKRMEDKFGPVELKDKLLNACGETATQPLEVTQFKSVAAADRIQAEVKYRPDVKFVPIAKHLISMNEFPGIKDKTTAFFRRIIVMEYKQKFEDEADDKELGDKLIKELDGIFMWSLEGLKRVLKNKAIYMPESVKEAKHRFRARVDPVIMFVEEQCVLGAACSVSRTALWRAWKEWLDESNMKSHLSKPVFYERILTRYDVKPGRPKGITTDQFIGIGLLER